MNTSIDVIAILQLLVGSGIFIILIKLAWQQGRYQKQVDDSAAALKELAPLVNQIHTHVIQIKTVCKLQGHWPGNGDLAVTDQKQ